MRELVGRDLVVRVRADLARRIAFEVDEDRGAVVATISLADIRADGIACARGCSRPEEEAGFVLSGLCACAISSSMIARSKNGEPAATGSSIISTS